MCPRPYRVLVVDDSVVIRRVVSDVLASDPEIDVVGFASNGRIALAKVQQLVPDLVILDVEMPEMDGLETLAALRRERPRLPVIMYSSLTHRGAAATLDALALGANDYVTKPTGQESPEAARRRAGEDLIPRVKALCAVSLAASRAMPSPAPSTSPAIVPRTRLASRPALLAIGSSTGGPNALAEIVPALPASLNIPVVIVQHMPPIFTQMLAERLSAKAGFPVREAYDGGALIPGVAWVAPGDHHMTIASAPGGYVVRLNRDAPENSCRPAVDVLLRSAVATHGDGVLAVILTGMGQDGLRGCHDVRARGGTIVVQDEASSVVWGMPGFVARAGLADRVLPLSEIASAITTMVCPPRPESMATAAAV